ncbi:MAG: stage II sporulation protein SpoIID, partial [Firmicutes bacterium]|nr:stage II sporulation protein SpoIID [Bacillota bacterium]
DDMQGLFVIGASGERVQLAASDIVAIDAESARNIGQKHLSDVVIEGNGHGHGVGMSQHGAVGMANAGYLYKDIISYYYFNNENFGMLNYLNGSAE